MIVSTSKKDAATWQARQDLDILLQCEAIEKDAARYKAAMDLAKSRVIELKGIVAESVIEKTS